MCRYPECNNKNRYKDLCHKHYMVEYHQRVNLKNDPNLTYNGLPRKRSRNLGFINPNGSGTYISEHPCKNGHLSTRYTKNGACTVCTKANHTKYRQKLGKLKSKEQLKKRYEQQPWLFLYYNAKQRAKSKNLPFNVTAEYIKSIWPKDSICPITKLKLSNTRGSGKWASNSASLDRIDPTKGYIVGNVAVISMLANITKSYCNDPTIFENIVIYLKNNSP